MLISLPTSKFFLASILFGYCFLSIFSLIHMSHMSLHGMTMSDCPYLALKHLPGNDLNAHVGSWQYYTLVILPGLFSCFFVLFVFFRKETLLYTKSISLPGSVQEQYSPPPPLTWLFSSGILHPKAP